MSVSARGITYNVLVRTAPLAARRLGGGIWRRAWNWSNRRFSGPVTTTIHGQRAVVNFGHTYAAFSRRYPNYNAPLVELVRRTARALDRGVAVADVGASVGDTVMLLDAACPNLVEHFHCVDGDDEFFALLEQNLGGRGDCTLHKAMLSAEQSNVAALVRTHGGTASAQGDAPTAARPLDDVLAAKVDVLKVDTDGFDGRVLAGATALLSARPAVIFEWHPLLYERTGNDPMEPFAVLAAAGYDEVEWYDKFGDFVCHGHVANDQQIAQLRAACMADPSLDLHFDVVAV